MRTWMLVALALAGCGETGGGDPTCASDYPPPATLDEALTECDLDDDCVVVELGVCDACNGGTAVAVSAGREGEVVDQYAECEPDGEWACTEMACPPFNATCDAGRCVLGQETTF